MLRAACGAGPPHFEFVTILSLHVCTTAQTAQTTQASLFAQLPNL